MERGVFDRERRDVAFVNRAAAYCLYLTHMAVTFLVAVGWLSPWDSILWAVIIVYAVTEILWFTRDGYCILTDLERWFLDIEKPENADGIDRKTPELQAESIEKPKIANGFDRRPENRGKSHQSDFKIKPGLRQRDHRENFA